MDVVVCIVVLVLVLVGKLSFVRVCKVVIGEWVSVVSCWFCGGSWEMEATERRKWFELYLSNVWLHENS